jgi:hypothetical protein
MCIVSGIGKWPRTRLKISEDNKNSMHPRSQYHMRRYSSPLYTEQEEFQDTRQQCLPGVVVEFEFWCHGKHLCHNLFA